MSMSAALEYHSQFYLHYYYYCGDFECVYFCFPPIFYYLNAICLIKSVIDILHQKQNIYTFNETEEKSVQSKMLVAAVIRNLSSVNEQWALQYDHNTEMSH